MGFSARAAMMAMALCGAGLGVASQAQAQQHKPWEVISDEGVGLRPPGAAASQRRADILESIAPQGVVTALTGVGLEAQVDRTSGPDPMVFSQTDSTPFQVLMGECSAEDVCSQLKFYVGVDVPGGNADPAWLNVWNARERFARVYRDPEGGVALEMDVALTGGVSPNYLPARINEWRRIVGSFRDFLRVGAKPAPTPPRR